ncbi:methyltransferase domain-containing protein [Jannaschia sp. W003]|uniref:methyltransferase domain-containing protein n=1 Tax=Jannaschia sp. W003 TaxID=2867012 RepID=UPI0021A888F6|nr:methyltransferase domain-containing protein [Jannaschia sp. W003]UWQ21498.1 methyltransferase domain-containing protein [Jannaschia sp. W003]
MTAAPPLLARDPFRDVDAGGPAFARRAADSMEARQAEPEMERIVAAYLDRLAVPPGGLAVEVGAGAGAITRRLAARVAPATAIGFDPSRGLLAEARLRGAAHPNLGFARATGTALPFGDGTVDAVVMHTVLSHVADPAPLLSEAWRVLRPGGRLAVCDNDYPRARFAECAGDPLAACARRFVRARVTAPRIAARLPALLAGIGFAVEWTGRAARPLRTAAAMMPWLDSATADMMERGEIGPAHAAALAREVRRRERAGTLRGVHHFAALVARRPDATPRRIGAAAR